MNLHWELLAWTFCLLSLDLFLVGLILRMPYKDRLSRSRYLRGGQLVLIGLIAAVVFAVLAIILTFVSME